MHLECTSRFKQAMVISWAIYFWKGLERSSEPWQHWFSLNYLSSTGSWPKHLAVQLPSWHCDSKLCQWKRFNSLIRFLWIRYKRGVDNLRQFCSHHQAELNYWGNLILEKYREVWFWRAQALAHTNYWGFKRRISSSFSVKIIEVPNATKLTNMAVQMRMWGLSELHFLPAHSVLPLHMVVS